MKDTFNQLLEVYRKDMKDFRRLKTLETFWKRRPKVLLRSSSDFNLFNLYKAFVLTLGAGFLLQFFLSIFHFCKYSHSFTWFYLCNYFIMIFIELVVKLYCIYKESKVDKVLKLQANKTFISKRNFQTMVLSSCLLRNLEGKDIPEPQKSLVKNLAMEVCSEIPKEFL